MVNATAIVGANPSTTLWGSKEMARPKGEKSEARRAERGGVLVEGMFPSPSDMGLGSGVSSRSGVRGKAPATLQKAPATLHFKTFYRLTKALLVSILVILH